MLVFSLLLGLVIAPAKPMELVFVRHGETVANATGKYNSKTIDTFSARGEKQVAELTKQLNGMRFNAIVVSPSPRALRTIAPYLRSHPQMKAVIWPELLECCDAHSKKIKGVTSPQIRVGGLIRVPADLVGLFMIYPNDNKAILAPSYDDGLRQIQFAVNHLKRDFGGSGKTVLVVGHSLHGGRMIEALEGKAMVGKLMPDNAKIMRFLEGTNGVFSPIRSGGGIPAPAGAQLQVAPTSWRRREGLRHWGLTLRTFPEPPSPCPLPPPGTIIRQEEGERAR